MAKYKGRVKRITEVPFAEVEIEAADEEEAEQMLLDMALRDQLGEALIRQQTDHYAIDIRNG